MLDLQASFNDVFQRFIEEVSGRAMDIGAGHPVPILGDGHHPFDGNASKAQTISRSHMREDVVFVFERLLILKIISILDLDLLDDHASHTPRLMKNASHGTQPLPFHVSCFSIYSNP
jgi:hypothetical protein